MFILKTKNLKKLIREITSLVLLLLGILITISSIVLYVGPPNHIAYFTKWTFLGLSKCECNIIHISTGCFFIIGLLVHIILNFKSILNYLKNKSKKLIVINKSFIIALIITIYIAVGSIYNLKPMSSIVKLGSKLKVEYVNKYGVPPYGTAKYSPIKKNINIFWFRFN